MASSEPTEPGTAAAGGTETKSSPDAEGDSAGAAPPAAPALDPWTGFRIDCLKTALYHDDRETYYARLHKLTMLVAVLSSASAFAFINEYRFLIAAVTVAGVVDLVFDVSGKARLHASLRPRVYDIYAQSEDTTRSIARLREQLARVYSEEPTIMHAVNALAYNAAMQSFGRPRRHQFPVKWWQRISRHWWPYTADSGLTRKLSAQKKKPLRVWLDKAAVKLS